MTISCKKCLKEFKVSYAERDRVFCGKICQVKSVKRTDIRKVSNCQICEKEFLHYGERVVCSRKCMAKYFSLSRIGENNPSFKTCIKEKSKCPNCEKEFEYSRSNLHIGQKRVFCSLACSQKIDNKGKSQSNYKSFFKYPFGWNRALKIKIKERDEYKCQICGKGEGIIGHHIHHIDYNKKNLGEENLITLCRECHNMTHHGRTFWEIIFSGLISGSKIVKKDWGAEIHIANNQNYCLKYLIFFKGKQFSNHYHEIKKELWHCVYGRLECILEKNGIKDFVILKQGDKIEVEAGIIHQLQAIRNSILIEVSSKDYPEDSIRLEKGIN